MKRKYEAMIVLDMKGKEESVEELVSGIGREMEKSGVKLEQIDKLGKRALHERRPPEGDTPDKKPPHGKL